MSNENERDSHLQIYINLLLNELCLSTNYFIFDNRVCILENSDPIGLTLMVVTSEAFSLRLEDKAIQETQAKN